MKIKKISALVAAAALACGLSVPASAVTLVGGDLKITFNAYDAGTIGYGNTNGIKCNSVATCNAVPGITPSPNAWVGGEDTWGIFSVQSITRVSNGAAIYTAGQSGEYLTGMFGGISDTYAEVSGFIAPATQTLGTGGWLNMYSNTVNYNSAFGPSGRLGQYGYNGITNLGGTLAMSALFGSGALGGFSQYSYVSNFSNATLGGGGLGYLDVIGGSLGTLFNTNEQFDPNGGAHDLSFGVTYTKSSAAGWKVNASGNAEGNAIPEPASLALFGLGLAGIACLRRRKA